MGQPDNMLLTEGDVALNGWIKIAKDGSVVMAMHRSDMGQGIHNALAMLVAEELDVPLKSIRLEQAGHDAIYGNVAMFVGTLPFHPLKSEGTDKPLMVKTGEWMVSKVARELGVNATGGSSSVKDAWENLRMAAATAKAYHLRGSPAAVHCSVGSDVPRTLCPSVRRKASQAAGPDLGVPPFTAHAHVQVLSPGSPRPPAPT
jgi:isoquinoline 1-oxidoreductase beta subunit